MSMEFANLNKVSMVPENMASLDLVLAKYFYNYNPEDLSLKVEKENYLRNIGKSPILKTLIRDYSDYFDLIFYQVCKKEYSSQELEFIVRNIRMRQEEVLRNQKETFERIKSNPVATKEEYNAGIFRESLEIQVRDAVFELQKKGYLPVSSGFDDPAEGTQYIMVMDININVDLLKSSLPEYVTAQRDEGYIRIVFKPKNDASVDELKLAWDQAVSLVPPDPLGLSSTQSYNGLQGLKFTEAQDKIRQGRNAWLTHGLAFVDGKVQEMSYKDFMEIENKSL